MSTLICNLPAVQVWVRKEYLRDHVDGHDRKHATRRVIPQADAQWRSSL